MKMKIPRYWLEDTKRFGTELTEVETIRGQKLTIPKKLSGVWQNLKEDMDRFVEEGRDPRDLLVDEEVSPLLRIIQELYLEIFEVQR